MRKLKLIWDFRGSDALKIAEHHELHLKAYIAAYKSKIEIATGIEIQNEFHAIAFLVVDENEMKSIRDVLKPHRGQLFAN